MKRTLDLPVSGMDCASCASHVRTALERVDGVDRADIRLAAEKAVIDYDDDRATLDQLADAVASAGYAVPPDRLDPSTAAAAAAGAPGVSALAGAASAPGGPGAGHGSADFARRAMAVTGLVFGAVLLVVVGGEWLGLFDIATDRVPFVIGVGIVALVGWPAFRSVVRAALRGRVIAHTLMSVGVLAALLIGQWVTAAVVAFFMRVGDFVEGFTTDRGRQALRDLEALAPAVARVERDHGEEEIPVAQVKPDDRVVVRPGERVPVDGQVVEGTASVEQAAITGESMPREVAPGDDVFAATIARGGALRIRATRVGPEATFGRILRMVEEAEGNRGRVESFADRFSGWYLPVVGAVALATYLIRGDVLATAAVLVVACSCAFAIATPVAMLASIGAAARRGLLIKGGAFVEALAAVDTVLVDKTGTSTVGRPSVARVEATGDTDPDEVLRLAASAEHDSEHPLAAAIRDEAHARGLPVSAPAAFRAMEGVGVAAEVDGRRVVVGSARAGGPASPAGEPGHEPAAGHSGAVDHSGPAGLSGASAHHGPAGTLEAEGMTVVHVTCDGEPIGVIGLRDELRPDVPAAIAALRELGVERIELLTGDHEGAAGPVASALGIDYRAGLLPEDKIRIVEEYQARGHRVAMIGDGVNDAPALARADVGIAMGAAGTDLALEVAHIALLRDDWSLVPDAFRTARRTMGVVRGNFAFTGLYNLVGLTLAAVGILPPILAAAAQSLPDLGILGNSARLLRR